MAWSGTPINITRDGSGEETSTSDAKRSQTIHTCRYEDFAMHKMSMLPNCPQMSSHAHCLMHNEKTCASQPACPGKCVPKGAIFLGSEDFVHKQTCMGKNVNATYNFYKLSDGTECYKKA